MSSEKEQQTCKQENKENDFGSPGIISKIPGCFLPGSAGPGSQGNENGIPQQTAPDSEPQKTWKIHICHTCGNGNQASDNGNEAAEEDRIVSFAVEPGHGFLNVFFFQTKSFSHGSGNQGIHFGRGKQFSKRVQKNSSQQTAKSRGKYSARYVQSGVSGEKSGEGEDGFRWNGGKDIFYHNQKRNSHIAICTHELEYPVIHRPKEPLFSVYAIESGNISRIICPWKCVIRT